MSVDVDSLIPSVPRTVITHLPRGASTRPGCVPADASNDRLRNTNDVLALINYRNGALV
ncbi:MAG: hypothetical protein ACE5EX_05825 [Phycisphaerae bacterium]